MWRASQYAKSEVTNNGDAGDDWDTDPDFVVGMLFALVLNASSN